MIGTVLNIAGILIGGIIGLAAGKRLSPANEFLFKTALGVLAGFYGLWLTWASLNGPFLQVLKQLLVVLIALMLGKLTGRLLHLQRASNYLGRCAREHIAAAKPGDAQSVGEGFKTCTLLFCAAPLGVLGALQDGLSGYPYALAVKGVMEGLAAMGFVSMLGWGVMLAALPVLAWQGTITLASGRLLAPLLQAHALIDPVNAAGGLLVFAVALVILELKKIPLADYLPSLAFAPLITWLWG
jgi:hypothetical protein